MSNTRIRCQRREWDDAIDLAVIQRNEHSGQRHVADPLTFRAVPDHGFIAEPTFRMDRTQAQQLMDELWNCGLRPSEGSGSAGSLAATERHLKDMQTIAMRFVERELVTPVVLPVRQQF